MERFNVAWNAVLGGRVSMTRMGGYGLLWLWTVMMFYSVVPYSYVPDARSTLYTGLTLSLITMVATMFFIAVALKRTDTLSSNTIIVWVSVIAMTAGSLLGTLGDPDSSSGMGVLVASSIMTGSGSAVLFVCWGEQFFGVGGRLALVELSVGSCAAFVVGLILDIIPAFISLAVIALVPIGSALLLIRDRKREERTDMSAEIELSDRQHLSKSTAVLVGKALGGVFLVGLISGFFDVIGGFNTYIVTDEYGLLLFVAGGVATLLLSVIALLSVRDGIFYAYRFSVLVLCLGCLLTPFLSDNETYFSTLIFAGYTCFTIILYILCIDVSTSFLINVARCLGLGFVALYGGEAIGHLAAFSFGAGITAYGLALMTLSAVSILLIAHLFLFTEVDLIKLGIGEVSLTDEAAELAHQSIEEAAAPTVDPAPIIVERYGLTPRESDVLALLLEGRTIQRIQETLYISAGTVSTHIRHIYQKTGSNNRQELIDMAQRIAGDTQENVDSADLA